MTTTTPDAEVIRDLAFSAAVPTPLREDDRFFTLVTPCGGSSQVIDVEMLREPLAQNPRRKKGTFNVLDAESFVAYMTKHAVPNTEVWADQESRTVTAVVNAHGEGDEGKPGHGDHRLLLNVRLTDAWKAWVELDRKMLDQVAFAEHVEDRLLDIVDPPGADLLEMVTTFTAKRDLDFKSSQSLGSGEIQFRYEETIGAKAGQAGLLEIPTRFVLLVAPFEGSEPIEITARLRYRLADGGLRLGYFLDRATEVLALAFASVVDQIEGAIDVPVLRGTSA